MTELCKFNDRTDPRNRYISFDGKVYLIRRYICGDLFKAGHPSAKPVLGWLPFTVYLHRFESSDPDRELHNHPWWALGVILKGAYNEVTMKGTKLRKRWSWRLITPWTFHRVKLIDDEPVETLFITSKRVQTWGYFVNWRAYQRQSDETKAAQPGLEKMRQRLAIRAQREAEKRVEQTKHQQETNNGGTE